MLQGDALGAAVIGALDTGPPGWRGPWQAGVRPGLGMRVEARPPVARPEATRGSRAR
ncbi:hypothetical protein J3E64_000361 [Sphingobium sp. OAS761]|uniref:hypothetical protein n=1 Tax=Sphingobium sp. OAS761 TaxID=2817901 RepID=UPI00209D466B|nr:hypothetical protein [Sphingobium sp. OAS761]MCP1468694.1 hypothetical protein [Sphingobium sp. OAS761]